MAATAAGNVAMLGGGWLTYLALRHLAGWQTATVSAVSGSVIASALLVGMLF